MRPKCQKLTKKYKNLDFLMEDESYFTLNNSTFADNDIYYAANPNKCPDKVWYQEEQKYEHKLLVSVCIRPQKISPLYIHHSKRAVNQEVYKHIFEETLMPLVSKYYKRKNTIILLSDLEISKYSKSIKKFLKTKKNQNSA